MALVESEAEMNKAYADIVSSKSAYKGIEREGEDLFRHLSKKEFEQYTGLFEDERIPFSENNLLALMHINAHIKDCEIIVFSENKVVFPESINSTFLGYDVSGDSMFLSPLYTAFFGNNGGEYFRSLQSKLSCGVNDFGLFNSVENAVELIELVNAAKDDNVFEEDGKLKPVFVYKC